MVQFNLLPDVKLQYVKARRTKYLITFVSLVVSGAALSVMLFSLFYVNVAQKNNLRDLSNDINDGIEELQNVEDLSKILTVQNQLGTLTQLHDDKPVTSRIFDYISQVTPSDISLSKLNIEYSESSLSVGGKAPDLDGVNLYAATLKATTYANDSENEDDTTSVKAFSNVVLSSFTAEGVFQIDMNFDPEIFSALNSITLNVPKGTTTSPTLFGAEVQ